ncbi:MAG: hypothetical protein AB4057_17490 [Crocosphaera sp.]
MKTAVKCHSEVEGISLIFSIIICSAIETKASKMLALHQIEYNQFLKNFQGKIKEGMTSLKTEVISARLFHCSYNIMSSQEKQGFVTDIFIAISGKFF